jgi:hypothetical protein
MAAVVGTLLVTRPVDLLALRQYIGHEVVLDRNASWEEYPLRNLVQYQLDSESAHVDIAFMPDRALYDFVQEEIGEPFLPERGPFFAVISFEVGQPFGETPEERLLDVVFATDPRNEDLERLCKSFVAATADWLVAAGCERVPWRCGLAPNFDWKEVEELRR